MVDKANTARKSCFLEENPNIISKSQWTPILQVEFETAKELFWRYPWNVADYEDGMSPNTRYIQSAFTFSKLTIETLKQGVKYIQI